MPPSLTSSASVGVGVGVAHREEVPLIMVVSRPRVDSSSSSLALGNHSSIHDDTLHGFGFGARTFSAPSSFVVSGSLVSSGSFIDLLRSFFSSQIAASASSFDSLSPLLDERWWCGHLRPSIRIMHAGRAIDPASKVASADIKPNDKLFVIMPDANVGLPAVAHPSSAPSLDVVFACTSRARRLPAHSSATSASADSSAETDGDTNTGTDALRTEPDAALDFAALQPPTMPTIPEPPEEAIANLEAMGFAARQARRALILADDNVNAAVEILLTDDSAPDELTREEEAAVIARRQRRGLLPGAAGVGAAHDAQRALEALLRAVAGGIEVDDDDDEESDNGDDIGDDSDDDDDDDDEDEEDDEDEDEDDL